MSVIKRIGGWRGFAVFFILVKFACSYSAATPRDDFAIELYDLAQRMHKNPNSFKNFKRVTQVAFDAAASDEVALRVNGLWLLKMIVERNAQFSQSDKAIAVALKGAQSAEHDSRIIGIVLLHELVKKDPRLAIDKLDEILCIADKAVHSVDSNEQGCGVQLNYLVVKRNKKFSKFDDAMRVANAALESKSKDVQAEGILLWAKLIKRNPQLSTHANVMNAASIVLKSNHHGTLVSGLVLLSRLVKMNPRFNKIDQTNSLACTVVQQDDLPLFNNGLILLNELIVRQDYKDFNAATQAVIKGMEVVQQTAKDKDKECAGKRILTNTVALLCVLMHKDARFDKFSLAAQAAVQATHSTHRKTFFNGLGLMTGLVERNRILNTADAHAVELAALRLVRHDDVRVRINALTLLRKLFEKQWKIHNLPAIKIAAETAVRSENYDERKSGCALQLELEPQDFRWVILLVSLLSGALLLWGVFSCIGTLRRRRLEMRDD